jgi:hypothetical protein
VIGNPQFPPAQWALIECDQCKRPNAGDDFPADWCALVLTLHPAMDPSNAHVVTEHGQRLRFVIMCAACNPYRLGPSGEPS